MEIVQSLDNEILALLKSMKIEPAVLRDSPERIPLRSPLLNHVLGGGLARERLQQIWGEESSGKSLLAELAAADITMAGGRVAWIDAEGTYNHERGASLGIVPERFVLIDPTDAEEILAAVIGFAKSKLFDLIVIDSVPALRFTEESDDTQLSLQPGYAARKMSKFTRQITTRLVGTRTAILMVNQVRSILGATYGPDHTYSGGKAYRHALSISLKLMSANFITETGKEVSTLGGARDQKIVAIKVRYRTDKNKTAEPGRSGETVFTVKPWDVSLVEEYAELAHTFGLYSDKDGEVKTTKVGGFYMNDTKLGNGSGLSSVVDAMYTDNDTYLLVKNAVDDHIVGTASVETQHRLAS